MSKIWLVIDRRWMSIFGVYDSKEKAVAVIENVDIIKGSKYYIEEQVVR